MSVELDPEGEEIAALAELVPSLDGARVLEVGCGDGRLTCRYAHRTRAVVAFDQDEAAIATFRGAMPGTLRDRVDVRVGSVATIELPPQAFDVVLLSWSL